MLNRLGADVVVGGLRRAALAARGQIGLTGLLGAAVVAGLLHLGVALTARRQPARGEAGFLSLLGRGDVAVVAVHHRFFDAGAIGGARILPQILLRQTGLPRRPLARIDLLVERVLQAGGLADRGVAEVGLGPGFEPEQILLIGIERGGLRVSRRGARVIAA